MDAIARCFGDSAAEGFDRSRLMMSYCFAAGDTRKFAKVVLLLRICPLKRMSFALQWNTKSLERVRGRGICHSSSLQQIRCIRMWQLIWKRTVRRTRRDATTRPTKAQVGVSASYGYTVEWEVAIPILS